MPLRSGAFPFTRTRRGFRPPAPLRGRARVTSDATRRIPERYALFVGNILARTVSPNRFVFAVHLGWFFFMRPLTCSLEPWRILRWTFRGALDVARARTFSSPPGWSDFALSASISARATRASLPTRASRGPLLAFSRLPLTNHRALNHVVCSHKVRQSLRNSFGDYSATRPSVH